MKHTDFLMTNHTGKCVLQGIDLALVEVRNETCRLPVGIPVGDDLQSSSNGFLPFIRQQKCGYVDVAHVCGYTQKEERHVVYGGLIRCIKQTQVVAIQRQQPLLPHTLVCEHHRATGIVSAFTQIQT